MALSEEVVVIGGGAAGIAATRRLHQAGVDVLLLEARERLGGRAWTLPDSGFALDLGCGWLHSADENPWVEIARRQGLTIDKTPPPWMRPSLPYGFSSGEQSEFVAALQAFRERLDDFAEDAPDVPASDFLPADARWHGLLDAISTFYSGVELDRLSTRDFARFDDSAVNWRVVEGFGRAVVAHAAGLPVRLSCRVRCIDWSGRRLRIETSAGDLAADAAIVTLPSAVIAAKEGLFHPLLPEKIEAAAALPLGLADKLFLSLTDAEEFPKDSRAFGRTDNAATGAYHFRPFGRPLIEAYFGGACAEALEAEGDADAFGAFAREDLARLLGGGFAARIAPIGLHRWRQDPFARGSYSYAVPGKADCRSALASPIENRIFFAGEACSVSDYSTAHGAYRTGIAAAEELLRGLPKAAPS